MSVEGLMVQSGELAASAPDADLVAQVSTGSAALDVAAAWWPREHNMSQMIDGAGTTVDTEGECTIE